MSAALHHRVAQIDAWSELHAPLAAGQATDLACAQVAGIFDALGLDDHPDRALGYVLGIADLYDSVRRVRHAGHNLVPGFEAGVALHLYLAWMRLPEGSRP